MHVIITLGSAVVAKVQEVFKMKMNNAEQVALMVAIQQRCHPLYNKQSCIKNCFPPLPITVTSWKSFKALTY
jgi:hypothetical protein